MDAYEITFETWNKYADWYQEVFMDFDLYDDSYDKFCNYLWQSKPKILEIGCGPGNITKYLFNKQPDIELLGIDVASNMIDLARANNPNADFQVMDCREIASLNRKFDAIICGFCMPYLSKKDCELLFENSYNLLNENGIAYFSFVNGDYKKSGLTQNSKGDASLFYFHENEMVEKILVLNNFIIKDKIEKIYQKNEKVEETHSIFIVQKLNKN